jgi:hypothetical protein
MILPAGLGVLASGFPHLITPASFANLVRWYDSDYYTGQGKVNDDFLANTDTWFDNSTNAVVATPVNSAKPQFKTSVFPSGKPAVYFNSLAKMTMPADVTFAGDFTAIVVQKIGGDTTLLTAQGENYQLRADRSGANKNSFFPNAGSEIISNTLATAITDAKANGYIRTGGSMKFWENAASFGSGTNSASFKWNIIGTDDGSLGLNQCNVGAIIVYSSALSDANYASLYTNYLKPRFGLP